MLMTHENAPVPAQSWQTAIALRRMALLQPHLPHYLLAPEVAVLLSHLPDERQRMLLAILWNTVARITEALGVTPEDVELFCRVAAESEDVQAQLCHAPVLQPRPAEGGADLHGARTL